MSGSLNTPLINLEFIGIYKTYELQQLCGEDLVEDRAILNIQLKNLLMLKGALDALSYLWDFKVMVDDAALEALVRDAR
jgi:hypothetical protein